MSWTHPTIERLAEAFPSIDDADIALAYGIMHCTIDPRHVTATDDWCRSCYNEPSKDELRMHAIDVVLEGFGVEAIPHSEDSDRSIWDGPRYEYVNTGDTYSTTVVFDRDNSRLFISCWGDVCEAMERDEEEED